MNSEAWPPPPSGANAPSSPGAAGAFQPPAAPPEMAPPTMHGVPVAPPSDFPQPATVVKLRSVTTVGLWSRILVIVAAVLQVISISALFANSPNAFARSIGPIAIMAHMVAGVVTVIWMFLAAANLVDLNRGTRWGPVWAIIGWFLPPLVFVIPTLQLGELWKASAQGSDWKSGPATPLAWIWGVLYSLCGLTALVTSIVTNRAAAAEIERLAPGQTVLVMWAPGVIFGALTAAAAAAVFFRLNATISARQRDLAANPQPQNPQPYGLHPHGAQSHG